MIIGARLWALLLGELTYDSTLGGWDISGEQNIDIVLNVNNALKLYKIQSSLGYISSCTQLASPAHSDIAYGVLSTHLGTFILATLGTMFSDGVNTWLLPTGTSQMALILTHVNPLPTRIIIHILVLIIYILYIYIYIIIRALEAPLPLISCLHPSAVP